MVVLSKVWLGASQFSRYSAVRLCHQRLLHASPCLWQEHEQQEQKQSSEREVPPVIKQRRRLDVAIVGLPNAGKSQLLNVLTGSTVAAVSKKRHTTRTGILGARTVSKDNVDTQILFVDTPGFLRTTVAKQEGLERDLMVSAPREIENVDYTLVVIDAAARFTDDVRESVVQLMLQALAAQGRDEDDDVDVDDMMSEDSNVDDDDDSEDDNDEDEESLVPEQKFAIVLNKVDLVYPKNSLLNLAMEISSMAEQCVQYRGQTDVNEEPVKLDLKVLKEVMPTFFYTNSLKAEGTDDLLNFLIDKATPSNHFEVEPGEKTSMTPEERAEEIIREKIYRCLHKEVPYRIRQRNRLFKVGKDKNDDQKFTVRIHQDLIVQTKSHRGLVYGALAVIHETAERDIQKAFGCRVILHLHVKLIKSKQRNWTV